MRRTRSPRSCRSSREEAWSRHNSGRPRKAVPTSKAKRARCICPYKERTGQMLRQNGLAVAHGGAGLGLVVIPEPEGLEFLLLGPDLVERVALEEFAILHHPVNGVGVVDVIERILVHDDQIRQLARLDGADVRGTPHDL